MQSKKWYLSKIFWSNTITFLIGVLTLTHEYLASIQISWAGLLLVGITGLTTLLRLFSTSTNLTT